MADSHIYISHSSRDDDFVSELRKSLEALGLSVWVDSRGLRGGAQLAPEVERAITEARAFIAVISPGTVNSPWVRREIRQAVEVEGQRGPRDFRVVPVLLAGIEPSALSLWFEEPSAVRVEARTGDVAEVLPGLLMALGERLPDETQMAREVVARPVAELMLTLTDPRVVNSDGKRRVAATARLCYLASDSTARSVESRRFSFNSPFGPLEAEDLRWYLESYYLWPVGVFKERALGIESSLPHWGRELYQACLSSPSTESILAAWMHSGQNAEHRFSVLIDASLPEGSGWQEQLASAEAAAELLSLPWELLHDGRGFLFQGRTPVSIRRCLPSRRPQKVVAACLPIRILLVSPRPEDETTPYVDHRVTALPLADAVEGLGELAELTVLTPPTFPAVDEAMRRAADEGRPFAVVHFDGHGVFDRETGTGKLCFEDPRDAQKLTARRTALVEGEALAAVARNHRIPLVFLDAPETATTTASPAASVAAKLLEEGVTSVVAMSHSVLVETARRFVGAFYRNLAEGHRVGAAMLAGQQELYRDTYRGRMLGAGELRLQDWFVPVLYQEEQDPQLISKLPPEAVRQLQARQRSLSFGEVPSPPAHAFVGRSRELLALERLLHAEPWAVVRGQGGAGKTTLVSEFARWLVRTGRHARAAFVSLEHYADARGVLESLGRQLLPDDYTVADYADLKQALQPVERALKDAATLIVLDNLESVLPDGEGRLPPGAAPFEDLIALFRSLLDASPATRLVFTTREPLPAPFNDHRRELNLGALGREDAVRLVSEVMKREGLEPKADDPGSDPQEVTELVEAAGCYARALVLLSREVARKGVRATTENLSRLMGELHARFPADGENSLYASVELSLRRLPAESRRRVKALAPFHGGAHVVVLAQVLGEEPDEAAGLARQLIEVGLAEFMGDGHLRLDPALPPYLLRGMDQAEQEELRPRWAEAMSGLTTFLYQQQSQDAGLAARLTLLELQNLLALLRWAEEKSAPEETVALADSIARLLSELGRPQALAEAEAIMKRAEHNLGGWGHASFVAATAKVERLMERGEVRAAFEAAERLLSRGLDAGEGAYAGAAYDLALAHFTLGRVLKTAGAADAALTVLEEARRRFESLGGAEEIAAGRMLSSTITEVGDCLRSLGRLDEAATKYDEAIKYNENFGDKRAVAVCKAQLGTIRLYQKRFSECLTILNEASRTFEALGEPTSMAAVWHQIGMAHMEAGHYEQAERAYRQSLAVRVQQKDAAGEAGSLNQLGNLYTRMARHEDSVKCYQAAANITLGLRDLYNEGRILNNLAIAFIQTQRYDKARDALRRATECKAPYGHAAEPWTTWALMQTLEQVTGNQSAAGEAWHKAVEQYFDYRRAGGYASTLGAEMCSTVGQGIAAGYVSKVEEFLSGIQVKDAETNSWLKPLTTKLRLILKGSRDPALAEDLTLDYKDAAELRLLLESLDANP